MQGMRSVTRTVGSALVGMGLAFAATGEAEAATWSYAGFPTPPRTGHGATRLADGRVLVAGGSGAGTTIADATLYDPAAQKWSATGPMAQKRALHCLVTLADGRALAIGGSSKDVAEPLASVEVYAPTTGTWSAAPPLSQARYWPACVVMKDGRVLVAGGAPNETDDSAVAEIFDPAAWKWTTIAPMPVASHNPRGVLLQSGEVLVGSGSAIRKFDPSTATWSTVTTTGLPAFVEMTLLHDGTVLIVGKGPPSSALYQPSTNTVVPTKGSIKTPHGLPRAVTLPNGQALVVGGVDAALTPSNLADVYDPKSGSWTSIEPLADLNALHTATLLVDGRVLVVGAGKSFATPAEIFNGVNGNPCDRPDDCGSGYCVDGVCCSGPCGGACAACNVKGSEGTCSPISGTPLAGHATCAPYLACATGACVASCSSDTDCSAGNVCFTDRHTCGPDRNLCGSDDSVIDRKTGAHTPCAPYTCSPKGECLTACGSSLDCAAGHNCADSVCVSVPNEGEGSSGGGCATRSQRPSGFAPFLLIGAALLAVRRRRRTALPLVAMSLAAFAIGCEASPHNENERVTAKTASIEWSAAGTMQYPVRIFHSATTLQDGRVLVTGGSGVDMLSASELFDPKTNTWGKAAPLSKPRAAQTALLLADGRVLVSGGRDAITAPKLYSTSELYDPAKNAWTSTTMKSAREGHALVELKDGRVLAAGGSPTISGLTSTAEVFDPATSTWTATSSMQSKRSLPAAALLSDGRVLVVGGDGGGIATEIWDPASGAWSIGPAIAAARTDGHLVRVSETKLVLVGGNVKTAEVLDENSMTWKTGAAAKVARPDSPPVLLANGTILLAGGDDTAAGVVYDDYETYDPVKDAWSAPRRLTVPRFAHTASLLASKRVLLVGGFGVLDEASPPLVGPPELLNLPQGATCAAHDECESGFCVDGFCCDRWCGAACEACNLAGKEGTCGPVTGAPRPSVEMGPKRPSCAPFGLCIEGVCASSCASDAYCDKDHVCDTASQTCVEPIATCDGASMVTDKSSGAQKDCTPFKCTTNGSCLTKCSSTDDCSAGAVCNGNACVVPTPAGDSGGCAIEARGRSDRGAATDVAWMLAACALVARRRRARAR